MAVRGHKQARTVEVGLSPVEVAPANRQRLAVLFRNAGKVRAYLGATKSLDANAPIVLDAGGTYRDDQSWDAWWAVAETKAGTTIALIDICR
jgi:hypothetical protein